MKLPTYCLAFILSGGLATGATTGGTAGKTQTSQQARQELDAAQKKLTDLNRELTKSEGEVQKADAAHQTALSKVQKARQSAAAAIGSKLGLPAALAQRDAAARAVDAAQKELSKQVRAEEGYQAAAKEAEKASTRLSEVRSDTTLAEDKKKELVAELSKTIRHPVEIERDRIEADSNIQQLRLKLAEAGKQAASIQAEVQKSVEDDGGVKAALQSEKDDAEKAKKAREDLDKQKKDIAAAQKQVVTEQQQYQKAVNATAKTAKKSSKSGK